MSVLVTRLASKLDHINTGAVSYGLAYDRFRPALTRVGRLGNVSLSDVLHVEPWLVVVLFAELTLFGFYALERQGRAHRLV